MKLTFITNACAIYEHKGFRLLADPWLVPGAFGTWVHDPPLKTKVEDVLGVDALYISHIHPDHLDPETLKHFRKDIPIVTLKEQMSLAEKRLRLLGFERILALADREQAILKSTLAAGQLQVTAFGPFTKHPFHADACEVGNVVDSALLIEAGGVRVLNANDNTMSIEAAVRFRQEYGAPDFAQLNSNAAGPYPACFRNLSHEEKIAERDRIVRLQTDHMVEVSKALGAKVVQPFAGQYRLGYGMEHLNQYLPVWSQEEVAHYLRERGVNAIVLKEGESWES